MIQVQHTQQDCDEYKPKSHWPDSDILRFRIILRRPFSSMLAGVGALDGINEHTITPFDVLRLG